MPENVTLSPEEGAKLRVLLSRADALGYAHLAVSRQKKWGHADIKAATLETLEEMLKEANERFESYRQELGIGS